MTRYVTDVFTTGGPEPSPAYVIRFDHRTGKAFEVTVGRLISRRSVVLVEGPTGSGKTWLATRTISNLGLHPAVVTCNVADARADLWRRALVELGAEFVETESEDVTTDDASKVSGEIGGGVVPTKVSGDISSGRKVSKGRTIRVANYGDTADAVIRACEAVSGVVVLEEFQNLQDEVARSVSQEIKQFNNQGGLPILVLFQTGYRADPTTLDPTLRKVARRVTLPPWTAEELAQVIRVGLEELNIAVAEEAIRSIASDCVGRPDIVHEVLGTILEELGIEEGDDKSLRPRELRFDAPLVRSAYQKVAQTRMTLDEEARGWLLGDGAANIAQRLFLQQLFLAITSRPEQLAYRPNELLSLLRDQGVAKLESEGDLEEALSILSPDSNHIVSQMMVWDKKSRTLHLLDASLLFLFRWSNNDPGQPTIQQALDRFFRREDGT